MAHRRKRKDAKRTGRRPSIKSHTPRSSKGVFERFQQAIGHGSREDLLRKIAGLQLLPANQNHIVGIIAALEIVSTMNFADSEARLQSGRLEKALNQDLLASTFVGWLEDPPANLFTENLIFHGGNYVVYTGLYPSGPFILSSLLESIFLNDDRFTKDYVNASGACALSLLTISNEIATRACHGRYVDGIGETAARILVPKDEDLDKLGSAVSFTEAELTALLGQHGLGIDSMRPFLTEPTDVKISGEGIENSVLCWSPVIELKGHYVVIPSMIVDALIHFILTMSLALNQSANLASSYRDRLWGVTLDNIALISHGTPANQTDLIDVEESDEIVQMAFKIDIDKLVYVQFVCDDFSGIDGSLSDWDDRRIMVECEKKQKSFEKAIRSGSTTRSLRTLTLRIVGTVGRSGRPRVHRDMTLSFAAQDLYILARLDEVDWLALWKYACTLDGLIGEGRKFLSFGPLDTYAAYYLNHRTFNHGERRFDSVSIPPNLDRDLRVIALAGTDRHAVLRDNPLRYTSVVLHFESDYTPIYIPDNPHSEVFGFMICGYPQPFWVSSSQNMRELSESGFSFVQLIAHWLAAINLDLQPHLENLGNSPIEVILGAVHFGRLGELNRCDDTEGESNKVSLTVRCRGIEQESAGFEIGASILDGTFDSQFMEHLLACIGDLLLKLGIDTLTKIEGMRIAESHFSGRSAIIEGPIIGRASLLSAGLPPLRSIQDHDTAVVIEELVRDLSREFEIAESYKDKNDTNRICHLAVSKVLADLRHTLSVFSWNELLGRLIEQNEVICHIRANNLVSIVQYARLYGFDTKIVNSFVTQNPRLDATALAVRALIELCAAEPSTGTRAVSDSDLDALIAKSNQLMTWANLSERIYHNLSRPTIRLLESGIIEVNDDAMMGVWSAFYRVKSIEDLERVCGVDQRVPESGLATTEEVRRDAYKDEFGFTFSEIVNLFAAMTVLGLGEAGYTFEYCAVVENVSRQLTWPPRSVELALSHFSLEARATQDVPADGCYPKETYPWRFNRDQSFIRRPIVSGHTVRGGRCLLFGPRHVEESLRHLVFLIETGRYVSRDSDSRMAALIGEINRAAGDRFTETVHDWLLTQTSLEVHKKVTMSPGGQIPAPSDMGDIDVLAIDKERHVLLLLECKNLHPARNPYEIFQERERVIGSDNEEGDSAVQKHLRRTDWVAENLDVLLSIYGLSGEYEVLPFFVTSSEVPSKYVANSRVRFVSISTLQKEGLTSIVESCPLPER